MESGRPGDDAMTFPDKALVVGTEVSMTSYQGVIEALNDRPAERATIVAVCNVHSVMSARSSAPLARALQNADIATSDGVPLVWALRWTVRPKQERVYGPELMRRALLETSWKHYFYGSTPETLDALQSAVARLAPDAAVVGTYSPPFRPMTEDERTSALAAIRESGADVVWVGLGMPKQELWMDEMRNELPGVALIGVGAAFDFIAGTKAEAPSWIQRAGLEWLFRLTQEPRRLWRRYIYNNPMFVVLLARQVLANRLTARGRTNRSA
jgi:N-acetylglucosaminyldiphosphoundecaprenol N-acetyl-beta-D-mannosaminyltransferase